MTINADFAAGRLTPRRAEVAELLVQGLSNREIGRRLDLTERTVKAHMRSLFLRFGLSGGHKRVKLAMLLLSNVLLLLATMGCVPRRPLPPSNLKQINSVQFRDCEIVASPNGDGRDGKNNCECGKIEWIRDAKEGRWIALCLK